MTFVVLATLFLIIGRRVGWRLTRLILRETSPPGLDTALCVMWGSVVALGMRLLIDYAHPGAVLRWIMGYALGWYVSVPSYGLLDESTLPDAVQGRYRLVSTVPPAVFLVASVLLALLPDQLAVTFLVVRLPQAFAIALVSLIGLLMISIWAALQSPTVAGTTALLTATVGAVATASVADLWLGGGSPIHWRVLIAGCGLAVGGVIGSLLASRNAVLHSLPFLVTGILVLGRVSDDRRLLGVAALVFIVAGGLWLLARRPGARSVLIRAVTAYFPNAALIERRNARHAAGEPTRVWSEQSRRGHDNHL